MRTPIRILEILKQILRDADLVLLADADITSDALDIFDTMFEDIDTPFVIRWNKWIKDDRTYLLHKKRGVLAQYLVDRVGLGNLCYCFHI